MAKEESVLVVERKVIEAAGMFQGLTFDVERYLPPIFAPGIPRFMLRAAAEGDPAYKQIIPYVIMCADGQYLTYVRGKQSGEKRLVGNRSIGIGGHINPQDDLPLFSSDFRETYHAAVEREVAEEVRVDAPHIDRIVALLNDDSTEVGRVHLGVVHFWTLEKPDVQKAEKVIAQLGFRTAAELHRMRESMETWSQLCLDRLDELARRAETARSSRKSSDSAPASRRL